MYVHSTGAAYSGMSVHVHSTGAAYSGMSVHVHSTGAAYSGMSVQLLLLFQSPVSCTNVTSNATVITCISPEYLYLKFTITLIERKEHWLISTNNMYVLIPNLRL